MRSYPLGILEIHEGIQKHSGQMLWPWSACLGGPGDCQEGSDVFHQPLMRGQNLTLKTGPESEVRVLCPWCLTLGTLGRCPASDLGPVLTMTLDTTLLPWEAGGITPCREKRLPPQGNFLGPARGAALSPNPPSPRPPAQHPPDPANPLYHLSGFLPFLHRPSQRHIT